MNKKSVVLLSVICVSIGVLADEYIHLRVENSELSKLNSEVRELRDVVTQSRKLVELKATTMSMCMITLRSCSDSLDKALPLDRRDFQQPVITPRLPNGGSSGAFEEGPQKWMGPSRKRRLEASRELPRAGGRGGPIVPDIPVVQLTEVPEQGSN